MIAAIVQARMTSTRLPGKVMKVVNGRPLISYLVERLRFCNRLDKIILSTTINKEDDSIVLFAKKEESLSIYRGLEYDVLDRYYQTAKKFKIDHIMRITSDCPLIDPQICDHIIDVYLSSGVDFVHTGATFAEGVDCEVLSFKTLEKAWNEASLKSEREHVTLYLHNHPEIFEKITLINETNDSKYRFTVDEPEDFEVVKAIIEALYRKGAAPFKTKEIITFLDEHPDIFKLNAHIIRNAGLLKSLNEDIVIDKFKLIV